MISPETKKIKNVLFKNQNLEYFLNTPLEIQRKDWEDSTSPLSNVMIGCYTLN